MCLGKTPAASGSAIGYRYHIGTEDLELSILEDEDSILTNNDEDKLQGTKTLPTSENMDTTQSKDDKSDSCGEIVKDHWNLFGKRSASVDSSHDSPFSNPIETWKKLNELKGKFTKTFEDKISEIKMDRNVLSKSRPKLSSSIENSSISDSEDTSDSSKLSEQWKDSECQITCSKDVSSRNSDDKLNCIEDDPGLHIDSEEESGLRHRKSSKKSDLVDICEIKIATPRSDGSSSILDESVSEDIESAVEAEQLDRLESTSTNLFEETAELVDGSHTPPGRGNTSAIIKNFYNSLRPSQMLFVFVLCGFGFYLFFPIPDFLKGIFLGFVIMRLWTKNSSSSSVEYCVYEPPNFGSQKYHSVTPLKLPQKSSKSVS